MVCRGTLHGSNVNSIVGGPHCALISVRVRQGVCRSALKSEVQMCVATCASARISVRCVGVVGVDGVGGCWLSVVGWWLVLLVFLVLSIIVSHA